ncbi:MAG TPA: hypothetical protein VEJ39_00935 [Candidatus Acidoferrales bacterium]|nr:hypothetical protein [Candidatus Acidoferrales bacterium]
MLNETQVRERGVGKFGGILFLAIVALPVWFGIKAGPAFMDNYQLQDSMQSEARFALTNRKSVEDVRSDIYVEIRKLDLPIEKKDIRVKYPTIEQGLMGTIDIDVDYSVPVDLGFYTIVLNFHPHGDNHTI